MIIFGGKSADSISSCMYEFLFATQEWTRVGGINRTASNTFGDGAGDEGLQRPPLLYNHSAHVVSDIMYVYGGQTYAQGSHAATNTVVFAFDFRCGRMCSVRMCKCADVGT